MLEVLWWRRAGGGGHASNRQHEKRPGLRMAAGETGSCRGHRKAPGRETLARDVAMLMIASEKEASAQAYTEVAGGLTILLLSCHNIMWEMLRY